MSFRIESDYKTRIEIQVQTHVRNLISLMTEFDESDENFGIAFDYIMSNIKNHKFLSVDKFRVNREIKGQLLDRTLLQEKFEIHSQESKAEKLKKLVDKFLKRKLKPHVPDIHHSILQFLLLMSNNPISAPVYTDDKFGEKYLMDDESDNRYSQDKNKNNFVGKNQNEFSQMINQKAPFGNLIGEQDQQIVMNKYDDDYVFESSSDEDQFDEENDQDEFEEENNNNIQNKNQGQFGEERSNFKKAIDVFGQDRSGLEQNSYQKDGIMKNKSNYNNMSMNDKSIDQSKSIQFKMDNYGGMNQKKDSLLSITNPHQLGEQSQRNINNNLSGILGGLPTNQTFLNITQNQSILKKSSLQRRTYEEFLTDQKNEEEKQLFLSTRQFTKNDLFRDPNSLAQVYENYIKETLNRQSNIQSDSNRSTEDSQLQLNHWIYQTKTERQIIQDIILMLQSQPSSTFALVGDYPPEFKLKKKIQVNHLTPSTLENMIDGCIDFANQLMKFQFYREQYCQIDIGTSFQAFLASIQAFYLQFQRYINAFHLVFLHQSAQMLSFMKNQNILVFFIKLNIEFLSVSFYQNVLKLYIVKKKEIEVTLEQKYEFMLKKTISLMELFRGLRDYQMEMRMMMNMLEGVIEIFKKSNGELQSLSPNNNIDDQSNIQAYLASQMIDFLYYQLQVDSQQYCKQSDLQQLNSQLFLLCIEPYLGILNDWLHGGFFYDKFSEFYIKNNTINQDNQQTHINYQHIDHKINWVKDFSIRFYQEPDKASKSVTPNFLRKYEQSILQIGKNVRLIGYILNEHSSKIQVKEKLKIDDIRDQIKCQITEAIQQINNSSTTVTNQTFKTNEEMIPLNKNLLNMVQETQQLSESNQNNINKNNTIKQKQNEEEKNQPKKFLKNLSISSILKQKNKLNNNVKCNQDFTLKNELENKSLQQSMMIDENQMIVEKEGENPFNIFTTNHSEIFNQSIFSLQDSFLYKVIPDLQKLNIKTTKKTEESEVNLNKKINQMIEQEGFTSQFLRLFELSLAQTLNQMDKQVKQYLGEILLNNFKLLENFQALRHIYFMENGHISTEFLTYLFDNLETYDTLKNASSLKNFFKEIVINSNQPCVKNLSENFSIEIQHDPVNTYLKNLKIKFDVRLINHVLYFSLTQNFINQAPYPLDAIFDQDSIFLYNHIFQFLVQLKKAQYFLVEKNYYLKKMRFFDDSKMKNKINFINKSKKQIKRNQRDDSDDDDNSMIKLNDMEVERDEEVQQRLNKQIKKIKWQMCLLQKQLLNVTNSFQYSTFIIIIQEKTKEFLEEISKEFNIANFIDIHKQYLKKIADLCFLSKKSENIFSIISSLLKFCCDFHALILRLEAVETLDQYTMKGEILRIQQDFDSLSMNFNRHNSFLINFLLKYEDKGLKQEWIPLNQALDFNYFYVKEDDIKRIYGKTN